MPAAVDGQSGPLARTARAGPAQDAYLDDDAIVISDAGTVTAWTAILPPGRGSTPSGVLTTVEAVRELAA
jgi:hypothetical protein